MSSAVLHFSCKQNHYDAAENRKQDQSCRIYRFTWNNTLDPAVDKVRNIGTCIKHNMEKDGSKEHIIPEAMGNSKLITYKVCEECNNRLGSKVDNYLTDYILTKIIRKIG